MGDYVTIPRDWVPAVMAIVDDGDSRSVRWCWGMVVDVVNAKGCPGHLLVMGSALRHMIRT